MKYTLIAYKPEESYWCGYDKEIHSADLLKIDDLTRQEVVNYIADLSKKPEFVYNKSSLYSDCPYTDFHIFEYVENTTEEADDIYYILEEGLKLSSEFNKEGEKKRNERWTKEGEDRKKKELEKKKLEYDKLKSVFKGQNTGIDLMKELGNL